MTPEQITLLLLVARTLELLADHVDLDCEPHEEELQRSCESMKTLRTVLVKSLEANHDMTKLILKAAEAFKRAELMDNHEPEGEPS